MNVIVLHTWKSVCGVGSRPFLKTLTKAFWKKKNRNKESIFRIYVNILRILRCGKLLWRWFITRRLFYYSFWSLLFELVFPIHMKCFRLFYHFVFTLNNSYSTLNILNFACTIFRGNWFFNTLAWIWISVFLDAPIIIHTCMTLSNVLDLAETAIRQKAKQNTQPDVIRSQYSI